MSDLQSVTEDDWQAKVESATGLVLVDFWAEWCGPCKQLTPILEKLAGEMADKLTVVKLDVSSQQELASRYGVMSIPTMIFFKNGENLEQVVGLRGEEDIKQLIDKHLA